MFQIPAKKSKVLKMSPYWCFKFQQKTKRFLENRATSQILRRISPRYNLRYMRYNTVLRYNARYRVTTR